MKTKSVAIIKQPLDLVWRTIRDRLPEIAPLLDDIEKVTPSSRMIAQDGTLHVVNVWKARPQLPSIISSRLDPEMLAWTDHSNWPAKKFECTWQIEPHFMADRIKFTGVTRYESALGGCGTRITFEGVLDIFAINLPGVPAVYEGAVLRGIESFLGALIPKNFNKLVHATAKMLDRKDS
jgi:hypothetical protein